MFQAFHVSTLFAFYAALAASFSLKGKYLPPAGSFFSPLLPLNFWLFAFERDQSFPVPSPCHFFWTRFQRGTHRLFIAFEH